MFNVYLQSYDNQQTLSYTNWPYGKKCTNIMTKFLSLCINQQAIRTVRPVHVIVRTWPCTNTITVHNKANNISDNLSDNNRSLDVVCTKGWETIYMQRLIAHLSGTIAYNVRRWQLRQITVCCNNIFSKSPLALASHRYRVLYVSLWLHHYTKWKWCHNIMTKFRRILLQ